MALHSLVIFEIYRDPGFFLHGFGRHDAAFDPRTVFLFAASTIASEQKLYRKTNFRQSAYP
jgi:hypothetical protein